MLVTSGGRPVPAAVHGRRLAADLLLLAVLIAAGWSVTALGGVAGSADPLAGAAALTAATLLALAGTAGADRRAQLIAAAVLPPAFCALLPPLGGGRDPVWPLLGHLALLGLAAVLAAAAGWTALGPARGRLVLLTALGTVLAASTGVAVATVVFPGWAPGTVVVLLTAGLGRTGLAAAAVLLVLAGTVEGRALLRRAGWAVGLGLLCSMLIGPLAGTLALASGVLVLVAAVDHLRPAPGPRSGRHPALRGRRHPALRGRRHPALRGRRHPALRGRRHPVLRAPGPEPGAPRPAELDPPTIAFPAVPATTPAEPAPPVDPPTGGVVAVRSVVDNLAALYCTTGQQVRVEVHGDPWVNADRNGLSQLLANLLANCARHAPGAPVRVCAAARGPRVRIEVIDGGPGLPPGATARLLRRGVRGPGSTGAGLGLAICTELVDQYRGSFTVVSTSAGCTAVVELPTARHRVSSQAMSA